MGQPKPPTPNPAKDLKESTQVYLKYLPQLQQAEQAARALYDPQRIQAQQALQQQYGPTQYAQQVQALQRLDPSTFGAVGTTGQGLRGQLEQSLTKNLGTEYSIPPDLQQAVASQYLGRQVAGGNVLGNAAATGADIYAGNAANQWYQQNVANAQRFLQGPSIGQSLLGVQPIAADRASAYVNPAAPAQAAQNSYQNALAAYQLQQGQGGGFGGALQGAVGGAQMGAQFSGGNPYAIAGGAIGGGVTGYFSDHRLKDHIVYCGRSLTGLPIFEFCYKNDCENRYRGTIAQEIMGIRPDAVKRKENGFYYVDYSKIDIPFEKVQDLVEVH